MVAFQSFTHFAGLYQHIPDSVVGEILECSEVFAGVKDVELNVAALVFPKTAAADFHMMAYTWDWIDARVVLEMAEDIIRQARKAIAEGELPSSVNEFIKHEKLGIRQTKSA